MDRDAVLMDVDRHKRLSLRPSRAEPTAGDRQLRDARAHPQLALATGRRRLASPRDVAARLGRRGLLRDGRRRRATQRCAAGAHGRRPEQVGHREVDVQPLRHLAVLDREGAVAAGSKLSSTPTSSMLTTRQIARIAASVSSAAAAAHAPQEPRPRRSSSARSTFMLGVRGSSDSATKALGTMNSGSAARARAARLALAPRRLHHVGDEARVFAVAARDHDGLRDLVQRRRRLDLAELDAITTDLHLRVHAAEASRAPSARQRTGPRRVDARHRRRDRSGQALLGQVWPPEVASRAAVAADQLADVPVETG